MHVNTVSGVFAWTNLLKMSTTHR